MREDIVEGKTIFCWYDSLDEFADAAKRRSTMGGVAIQNMANGPGKRRYEDPYEWYGGSFEEALEVAATGWEAKLDETLALMDSAIEKVTREHEVKSFVPTWEVTGAEVDVARYLEGVPENMIDFPMQDVSKLGKVITFCASVSASSVVEPDALIQRGQVLAAFAMLITKLGYSAELWIDMSVTRTKNLSVKTLVKGTNDTVDPARIVGAYAHPGMLRSLMFAIENGLPGKWFEWACGGGRGMPVPPVKNLPEGTIYLPELRSGSNVPDADEQLLDLLRQAGLVDE